ncbi:MAG: class I SAM-dependent methyltransferase [Polyangiales bacterium]
MNDATAGATGADDRWAAGDAYELYMGRWSRAMAQTFLGWLVPAPHGHWLEVGCGTGALTSSICALASPASLTACDQSAPFIEHASRSLTDARVSFVHATGDALPTRATGFDVIVSGLVLNFIPEPSPVLAAMRQRLCPGGVVAAYLWDYRGGVDLLQHFWQEAAELDPQAATLDESRRFHAWQAPFVTALFTATGLTDVVCTALTIPTVFASFDDYWQPFLGGTGPAPSHVASLTPRQRETLAERLRARLPTAADGSIPLKARAFAVRGRG